MPNKSAAATVTMPRLKAMYQEKLVPSLKKELNLQNTMEVPRFTKITLNMGVGEAINDKKLIQAAQEQLTSIAGQHAIVTYARQSIAGFKIREGWPIGCKVTLRGARMYQFLERLLSVALPCVRDFRGLNPRSFDGRGNYSLGVKEHIIFPEINLDKIDKIRGLDITITTTAKTNEQGYALLKAIGFPFREKAKAEDNK